MNDNGVIIRDPREDNLPKWARDIIKTERRRADEAEAALAAHQHSLTPSRIWHGDYDNPVYLPQKLGYERVHFNLSEKGNFVHRDDIQIGIHSNRLEVMGGRGLVITPMVSNVVTLSLIAD